MLLLMLNGRKRKVAAGFMLWQASSDVGFSAGKMIRATPSPTPPPNLFGHFYSYIKYLLQERQDKKYH